VLALPFVEYWSCRLENLGRGEVEASQMKASSNRGRQSSFIKLGLEFAPNIFTAPDYEMLTICTLEKPM
jgi:hypothetical protein